MPRFSVRFFFYDKDVIEYIITAETPKAAIAEGRSRLKKNMGKPWRRRVKEIN